MNFSHRSLAIISAILLATVMTVGCNRESSAPGTSDDGRVGSSGTSGRSGSSDKADRNDNAGAQETSGGTSGSSVSNAVTATGTAASDTLITGKIKSAFLADSDLKSMGISVDTNEGEVTLTGALANQAQIDRAVNLASAVSGVKSVRNRLAIKR
jgi:osmotically-inducible protein OsmY